MARCLRCGNTSAFNVWCSIQKVLEVELNEKEELVEIIGEPEDESFHSLEDIELMEDDLAFAMVSCAWCGSKEIEIDGKEEVISLRIRH
ncbi:MAG: hypothetical protein JRI46_03380 [Deltaproteobacteria bacterium]|nr:hypothetical protein [Deltaproteobacteria bacterium]